MDSLTLTVHQAGRPVLTRRVGALSVIDRQDAAVRRTEPSRAREQTPPPPPGPGSGLGPKAQSALVASSGEQAPAAEAEPDKAEAALIGKLQARDAEVRRHEEAHARVGGQYAGQPSYTYQSGPDGKRYAIGGEVPIDVAPIPGDPAATIDKMRIVKAAALAPAEPSGADRRVAALADAQARVASAELAAERQDTGIEGLADILSRGSETEPGAALDLAA